MVCIIQVVSGGGTKDKYTCDVCIDAEVHLFRRRLRPVHGHRREDSRTFFSLSLSLPFMATQLCISAHTSNTLLTVTGRHGSSQVHAVKIHCEKKKKLVQMLNICTDGETTEMRAQQRGSPLSDGPTRKMKSWPGANRGCRKCSCQTLATPGPVWRNACKHSVLIRTRNIW